MQNLPVLFTAHPFLNPKILYETYELVSSRASLDEWVNHARTRCEAPYFVRINRWLEFFNSHFASCCTMYVETVHCLFQVAADRKELFAQTQPEFEISRGFFLEMTATGKTWNLRDSGAAGYLWTLALLAGKYPGMVQVSLCSVFRELDRNLTTESLMAVFEKLFVRYESPRYIVRNLPFLELWEFDILFLFLSGKPLRKISGLPLGLSLKEQNCLLQVPEMMGQRNNILTRWIVMAKLLKGKLQPDELDKIIYFSRVFEGNLDRFHTDIHFWRSAFEMISIIQRKTDWARISEIQEIMDFLEFMRYHQERPFSLKGMTEKSLARRSAEWHRHLDFEATAERLMATWGIAQPEITYISKGRETYSFEEICTGKALHEETQHMRHCAFFYIYECHAGLIRMFSVRKKTAEKFARILTIEVRGNTIKQVRGKFNREPSKSEMEAVAEWAERKGIFIL